MVLLYQPSLRCHHRSLHHLLLPTPGGKTKAVASTWQEQIKLLDLEGTFFFIPGVICLLLALQWGGTKYPWSDGRIIALFVLFGVLIIAFVAIQIWKGELATVPPRIFKNRNIWGCALYAAFQGAAFFIFIYYVSASLAFLNYQGIIGTNTKYRFPFGSKPSRAPRLFDPVS